MNDFCIPATHIKRSDYLIELAKNIQIPDFWQAAFEEPASAIEYLLTGIGQNKKKRELINKLRASHGTCYIQYSHQNKQLALLCGFKNWGREIVQFSISPPLTKKIERKFPLQESYEQLCQLTGHLDVMFVKTYDQVNENRVIARPYGANELYIDSNDGYMNDEELTDVLANSKDYGWTDEQVRLNQRSSMYCLADIGNSDFIVFHTDYKNQNNEAALLQWFHDRPGGFLPNELKAPETTLDFGQWLADYIDEVFLN